MRKKEIKERDILNGGKGDNLTLIDIAKKHDPKGFYHIDDMVKALTKQLNIGMKEEMEHTNDKRIAKEIAMDHLSEDPTYYTKLKKIEADEQTMADASGSFEGPAFGSTIVKREIHSIPNFTSKKQDVDEITDASSSGAYDVPFGDGSKNPLKIGGPKSIMHSRAVVDKKFPKWGGPGGTFVKINEKCKKFPYCNQGSPEALQFYESKGMSEPVREVSKKYGLPYNDVKNIVLNEITQIFMKKESMIKPNDMDNMLNEILENEAKRIIKEQVENSPEETINNDVKQFQSLSDLVNNISNIENIKDGVLITIDNITEDELINDCGGSTFEEAQKYLMQGLHHDLEDIGLGNNFDVEINTEGDENQLTLKIKISSNKEELLGATEMKENSKGIKKECTECDKKKKAVDEKAKLILGNKKQGCSECGGELNEEGTCNECSKPKPPKKKIIKVTESKMIEMIKKIIREGSSVPGVAITDRSRTASGKENKQNLDNVTEKIKKYLSFNGNDNPEFPNQIGAAEKKAAVHNTTDENDTVEANRGRGLQDLNYDNKPSEEFQARLKMSLEGDPKSGNSQDALNVVKSKTGEKKLKEIPKKQKAKKEEPIYNKEAVPVSTKKKAGIEEDTGKTPVLTEIQRMKEMFLYNKNSQ